MATKVKTSSEKLTLYAGMTMKASEKALQESVLRPEFFMITTAERCWIPMSSSPQGALERALWGAKELGEDVRDPKKDLVVVEIVFTAHGVGYFHTMKNLLTTHHGKEYWEAWRFYGNIYETVRSEESGDILVQLTTANRVE